MKTFKVFYKEASAGYDNVPVVSIEKNQVDLNDEKTLFELNRNISLALSKDFSSAEEGLLAAKKILTMYGIEIPEQHFYGKKGKISVPVCQYKSSGESHFDVTSPFSEKNEKHTFVYSFELKDGVFDVHGEVSEN